MALGTVNALPQSLQLPHRLIGAHDILITTISVGKGVGGEGWQITAASKTIQLQG